MTSASPTPTARFGPVTVHFGDRNGKYPDGNQVIVSGADLRVAFDTPPVANTIGEAFDTVDQVLLGHVHEDHIAGLHRVPQASVYAHRLDVEAVRSWDGLLAHYGLSAQHEEAMRAKLDRDFSYQPRPDAIAYDDGACWDLGGGVTVTAIHMPGHTSGHSALLVEPEGVAFIGDIDLSGFGPYYGDATSSLRDFRRTLTRLPQLAARVWVTSHHRGAVTDRGRFLEMLAAFAAKLDERGARLLDMLAERPRSIGELVEARLLYPPGFDELWVLDAERRTIGQHVAELIEQERIRLRDDGRYVTV